MEELKNYNQRTLFRCLEFSDADFLRYLSKFGIVPSPDLLRKCDHCATGMMAVEFRPQRSPRYLCNNKECRKSRGYFMGTFFEKTHLKPKEVWQFTYYWCWEQLDEAGFMHEMRRVDGSTLSTATITDWKSFCRDVTDEYFIRNPVKIGGVDEEGRPKIVEIDETIITRRKYNRGRGVNGQWLFGGVERGTNGKRCFLVECPATDDVPQGKRDAATLLPMIEQYILPGTIIMSDLWRGYFNIKELPRNYTHLTVNHSIQFVNPENNACTNTIEGTWQDFKNGHKRRYGTARSLLPSYLPEFMWRRCFKGPDVFYHFWSQVAEIYKLSL